MSITDYDLSDYLARLEHDHGECLGKGWCLYCEPLENDDEKPIR